MIPDHLIDKGVDALINPARTTDMVPDWRLDVYRDTVQRIIKAVAADIWDEGADAGETVGYGIARDNWAPRITNPYRASETA